MDAVRTFTADVLPVLDIIWVTEGLHRAAHHAFLVMDRRRLSLVDCVSLQVMRDFDIDTAFCFDPNSAEKRFGVLSSRAP